VETYRDINKFERVYQGVDEEGENYQYYYRTSLEGFEMGNKYIDFLEELAELIGMTECDIIETLIAERLQELF
jgi:hypothetical protein